MEGMVAPFAGAWIEIIDDTETNTFYGSLPSRERGLKLVNAKIKNARKMSLPSRERGLKYTYT